MALDFTQSVPENYHYTSIEY